MHMPIVWIFITRISHRPFLLSKNGLCVWISAFSFVQNDVFLKVPYIFWVWDFVNMYLIHLRIRIWSPPIYIYSKKCFFWPPKHSCIPWVYGEKLFFQLWTIWSCKKVRNETIRFGGHVDLQVSYKILWSKIPKKALILHNLPCFQEGLFEAVLDSMRPLMFRN